MTTKLPGRKPRKVKDDPIFVVATNPDYAKVCAHSVKRLPSRVNVRLLTYFQGGKNKVATAGGQSTVVVSRLNDISHDVIEIASSGPATKQLVFLDTLPVEAMAARLMPLRIRNPERIHIAAPRDPSQVEALIFRLIRGLAERAANHPIVDAWIENEQLVLLSPQFFRLEIPLAKLARFIGTDSAKVAAFEIDEDGRFLYWPHADVHLGWMQFQQIIDPAAVLAAAQKTDRYNRRYGAAIRAMRESHGLKQSEVPGITDRQLRRVEKGQQSVSKWTLEVLAKAHSLSLEEYVDRLAKAVSCAEGC